MQNNLRRGVALSPARRYTPVVSGSLIPRLLPALLTAGWLTLCPSPLRAQEAPRPPATPAELFAALAKEARPQWRAYYREQVPHAAADRFRTALSLGAVCADCYLAAEARDAQQLHNLLTDMAALEMSLSISRQAGGVRQKFTDLAEAGDWAGVRTEIAGLMTIHAQALTAQKDEALAELERTGCWLRAWHIAARYASRQTKAPAPAPAGMAALVDDVRTRTAKALAEAKVKNMEPLTAGLDALHKTWSGDAAPEVRMAETLQALETLMAGLIGDAPAKSPAAGEAELKSAGGNR
jgi:hypothetical protein